MTPRTQLPSFLYGFVIFVIVLWGHAGHGRDDVDIGNASIGHWKTESIVTHDGRTYRGLIQSRSDNELEFVEVVQPRGKPMHLVIRPVAIADIAREERLSESEREELSRRVDKFRHRAFIEAGRMESVELITEEQSGTLWHIYHGPWFDVRSSSDLETTRRAIVRVEQIFRAYRQLIFPRIEPQRRLTIVILGSMDEYRTLLARHELKIKNPAVYSQQLNMILAGCELTRFGERLEQARTHHERIRQKYELQDKDMAVRLSNVRRQLEQLGLNERTIEKEINARLAQWNQEKQNVITRLAAANRLNEARFADLTEQMFRRLSHEGLHAYLENFVYPHEKFDVPTWLHEGLAQVFEGGRLEAGMLRIDSPNIGALARIQASLAEDRLLPLAELIAANRQSFLDSPGHSHSTIDFYAYSWALTYYLLFERSLLTKGRLDQYVATPSDDSASKRFELLTGEPPKVFEKHWKRFLSDIADQPHQ